MDDSNNIILFLLGALLAVAIFMGVRTMIRKSFQPTQQSESLETTDIKRTQRQRINDIKRQQKDYMRNQRQRIKDLQRR